MSVKKLENRIQKVQNSCMRFCYAIPPRSHITPFLNTNNHLNMKGRRLLKLYTLLFGLRKTGIPSYLSKKFCWTDNRPKPSRHPRLQINEKAHLKSFRGSFRFASTKCWNDLPPPIRIISNLRQFKHKCKAWLLDTQKSSTNWSCIKKKQII